MADWMSWGFMLCYDSFVRTWKTWKCITLI